jgi:hypothetical protein
MKHESKRYYHIIRGGIKMIKKLLLLSLLTSSVYGRIYYDSVKKSYCSSHGMEGIDREHYNHLIQEIRSNGKMLCNFDKEFTLNHLIEVIISVLVIDNTPESKLLLFDLEDSFRRPE